MVAIAHRRNGNSLVNERQPTYTHVNASHADEGSTHSVAGRTIKEVPQTSPEQSRRLRFAVDEDDCILAQVVTLPEIPDELKEELFYSRKELQGMVKTNKRVGKYISAERDDLVQSVNFLYGLPVADSAYASNQKALETLFASGARGLERQITSRLSEHRRWAVKCVLFRQQQLREDTMQSTSQELQGEGSLQDFENELQTRSLQVTRRSREFGLQIGREDAATALVVYAETY